MFRCAQILEEMNEHGIQPNPLTFSILTRPQWPPMAANGVPKTPGRWCLTRIKHKKGLECLRSAAQQHLLLPQLVQ